MPVPYRPQLAPAKFNSNHKLPIVTPKGPHCQKPGLINLCVNKTNLLVICLLSAEQLNTKVTHTLGSFGCHQKVLSVVAVLFLN